MRNMLPPRLLEDHWRIENPEAEGVSLIDAIEKLYGGTANVAPAYYARIVLAVDELIELLASGQRVPFTFKLRLEEYDDKDSFNGVLASMKGTLSKSLARVLTDGSLKKWTTCGKALTPKEWYWKEPISPVGRWRFLYALEKMRGYSIDEIHENRRLGQIYTAPSPLQFFRECSYSEYRLSSHEEGLVQALRSKVFQIYTMKVALGERYLVDYLLRFEDVLRICIWKGFPIRDEYMGLINDAERIRNRDYTSALTDQVWPLPEAVRMLFGDIGAHWKQEEEFTTFLGIHRPMASEFGYEDNYEEHMRRMRMEKRACISKEDYDTGRTIEYEKVCTAVSAGHIKAVPGKIPGTYLVTPASFIGWATSQGFVVPTQLQVLLKDFKYVPGKAKKMVKKHGNEMNADRRHERIVEVARKALQDGPDYLRRPDGTPIASSLAAYLEDNCYRLFDKSELKTFDGSAHAPLGVDRMRLVIGKGLKTEGKTATEK